MKGCDHIRKELTRILDTGETTPSDSVRVHLRECPACAAWWEQMTAVEASFREAGDTAPPAPDTLVGRVLSALESEKKPSRSWAGARLWGWRWAAAAAMFLLVAAVSMLLWTSHYPNSTRPLIVNVPPIPTVSSLASLDELVNLPQPVVKARVDLTWLTRAVVSNTESALRAVVPDEPSAPRVIPTETPQRQAES